MSTKVVRNSLALLCGLVLFTSIPVRGAGCTPGTDKVFASRFAYIEKLVEHSSAARQVATSANGEAQAKWQSARSFYRQARDALNACDDKLALASLNKALADMGQAARIAARKEIDEEKRRQEFQAQLDTVNALLAAHDRVSSENGAAVHASDSFHHLIQRRVSHAEALYARGNLIPARNQLDEAYGALTVAIDRVRGGRTLVHSLSFATKEAEYKYEFGRNRSHRMLVKVLLEDTMRSNPNVRQIVDGLMGQADKARATAIQYAKTGDYTAAVVAMEMSTAHIVRAIRGAGIYIPG